MTLFHFNFQLKEEQITAIQSVLNGKDTFVSLGTGFGKSMIYIIPPLVLTQRSGTRRTALVISPLNSIMIDQSNTLSAKGIETAVISEHMTETDRRKILSYSVDIIFASPESALLKWFRTLTSDKYVEQYCLVAFDECHCISEWGLDFRPKYREINRLSSVLISPIVCLTGTVTKLIQADILCVLKITDPCIISSLPDRPNIFIKVERPKSTQASQCLGWILNLVQTKQTSCPKIFIFLPSINDTGKLYGWAEDELMELKCFMQAWMNLLKNRS